ARPGTSPTPRWEPSRMATAWQVRYTSSCVTRETVRQRRYAGPENQMDIYQLTDARRLIRNPGVCRAIREAGGASLTETARAIPCSPGALLGGEGSPRRPRSDLAIAWAAVLRDLMKGAA